MKYSDSEGVSHEIYGDLVRATKKGSTTVKGTANISSVKPNTETGKVEYVSTSSVPTDCSILKSGILTTDEAEKAANLSENNATFVRFTENPSEHNVNFTWRKKDMTVDTYMYVRGYLVYVDNEGIIHNVYGKVVKTNVNGIVD